MAPYLLARSLFSLGAEFDQSQFLCGSGSRRIVPEPRRRQTIYGASAMKRLSILAILPETTSRELGLLSAFSSNFVLFCRSADDAAHAAAAFEPDLVVVDLRVPGANSIVAGLCEQIGRTVPFIAIGSAEVHTLPPGYSRLLHLPVSAHELEQCLREILPVSPAAKRTSA